MMLKKLAVKRLTASDLTFFEWHFRNRNAGNQKAINLNANVFIQELYPTLPSVEPGKSGRFPLDLFIFGPAGAGEYNLQRKIIKGGAYKNWRLDGEFVYPPQDNPDRFNNLEPDDLVVFEFTGEIFPISARAFFLAAKSPVDLTVHQTLLRELADAKMAILSVPRLTLILESVVIPPEHPLNELTLDAALEDAGYGGIVGTKKLIYRRSGRRLSRDDIREARERAEVSGRLGEEFINAYLLEKLQRKEVIRFEWVSDINAISPYDFHYEDMEAVKILLDVKATLGEFERPLHISYAELVKMAQAPERYDLYRVFEIGESTAKLRVAIDVRSFAGSILKNLDSLPEGVTADGVSALPERLSFGETVLLMLPNSVEDPEFE